jgi:hypothetical protein
LASREHMPAIERVAALLMRRGRLDQREIDAAMD